MSKRHCASPSYKRATGIQFQFRVAQLSWGFTGAWLTLLSPETSQCIRLRSSSQLLTASRENATEPGHHGPSPALLPAHRPSPVAHSFLNMSSFLCSAQRTLALPSRPIPMSFLHHLLPVLSALISEVTVPFLFPTTTASPSPPTEAPWNYTATADLLVCLHQETAKL